MPEVENSGVARAMVAAFSADQPLTMSSREIAELCEKRHDHVMRDIKKMLDKLGEVAPKFGGNYIAENGKENPCFLLPKDLTLTLVAGYNVKLRKRIIDRWLELEGQPPADPLRALNDPATMRGLLLTYSEKVLVLEGRVDEMQPQVQALERIATSDGSLCITDTAKTLQVRPKTLFEFLRSHGWIYSRGGGGEVAYQDKLASGLLEHKTMTVYRSDGSEKTATQVRVTPKGLTRLAQLLPPVAKLV
ncbi:phage antirepressor KilAC domain-containing protein [Amaricoccus solimangrovi]|uniref:Antirepressor protein C-terminal domain-containing protein n=1 Tax=Amaricoccus solimangrovi TaxID=2589815 RepID=A0A501WJ99_9RHOB|nr:phage regulatory protein/antirepressor Ant [Amaricoccus solimangrovi]TPE47217.1 hypothetical protein FJM51_20390 [Amaricoccus solimangrovi]